MYFKIFSSHIQIAGKYLYLNKIGLQKIPVCLIPKISVAQWKILATPLLDNNTIIVS